ncbi:uncharacterized protein Dwil_GK20505 [Drosophila willistoni]|uniref:GK20505 n=2 Tax=Drosophila willistoni TaxID=7260 RepID=B4N551_DROWI|nr:SAC3 domain-containing protein 1 isoform X1 [Drosophila willistoni]EDW79490.1 uncharacterized protein Dwil_GK20505 [Drosophila willistoni]
MDHIVGTCDLFCPTDEAKLRIREKLLHFYELKNGVKNQPGILVKEFTRSAADVKTPKAKDLRTEASITRTVEYLLKDILMDTRKPYHVAYDFIFDRLRAVRREIVIQMYDSANTICILEPIISFLAYSRYRLSEEPIDKFDPKICDQHLQECLNGVLYCYDDLDETKKKESFTLRQLERRCFIESLYQIFHLGSIEPLARGLTLPEHVRQDAGFRLCFDISLAYQQGNLYRVLMGFPRLPHIIGALAATKLQFIRRRLLQIFTHAYHNKQLSVPVTYLLRLLLFESPDRLIKHCTHYNLSVTSDRKAVHFIKTDFNISADTLQAGKEPFVETKLAKIYLPEIVLLKALKN